MKFSKEFDPEMHREGLDKPVSILSCCSSIFTKITYCCCHSGVLLKILTLSSGNCVNSITAHQNIAEIHFNSLGQNVPKSTGEILTLVTCLTSAT